jgi:serine/threonine protein kinase
MQHSDAKRILNEKYAIIKRIGTGSFSTVWEAVNTQTQERVAIKQIINLRDVQTLKRALREIRLLRFFKHPNIIDLHDVFVVKPRSRFDEVYLVYSLMDIDLHNLINSNCPIQPDHHRLFLYQLLCGLKYIHSASVIHRDLKPKNILINRNGDLKICDFGMGRGGNSMNLKMTCFEEVATSCYRAPEGILDNKVYTQSVDVWAAGCILAELILRHPLFPARNSQELLEMIVDLLGASSPEELHNFPDSGYKDMLLSSKKPKKPLEHRFPHDTDPIALDLLEKMLVFDPRKRITVEDALRHQYFDELHDSDDEPIACGAFTEPQHDLDRKDCLELIWKEIQSFEHEETELRSDKELSEQQKQRVEQEQQEQEDDDEDEDEEQQ